MTWERFILGAFLLSLLTWWLFCIECFLSKSSVWISIRKAVLSFKQRSANCDVERDLSKDDDEDF